MNQKEIGIKLKKRRELLYYSQLFMATKLNITQPAYSWMENGKIKFTDELLTKIKTIEGFESFDLQTEEEEATGGKNVIMKWPWGKASLYVLIFFIAALLLDWAMLAGQEISRGFSEGKESDGRIAFGASLVFISIFAFLIYRVFWKKKW